MPAEASGLGWLPDPGISGIRKIFSGEGIIPGASRLPNETGTKSGDDQCCAI
jgi:hypothetical protein